MSGSYDDAEWNGAALPAMLTYDTNLSRTGFIPLPTEPPMARRLLKKVFVALAEVLIAPAYAGQQAPPVRTFACDVIAFDESIWVAGGQWVRQEYAPASFRLWQDGQWVYNLPDWGSDIDGAFFLDFAVAPALPPLLPY